MISGRFDHLKLVGTSCRFILGEVGLRLFQSSWKLGQKLVGTPCKSYRSNDADCKTRIDQWRKCAKCRLSAKKEARYFVRLLTLKREWHFISTIFSIVVVFSIQCNACHCFLSPDKDCIFELKLGNRQIHWINSLYVILYPRKIYQRILCPNGTLLKGYFAHRTRCPKDVLLKGYFVQRALCQKDTFPQRILCPKNTLP